MKWMIWAVGGLLAAIWTGAFAVAAAVVQWTSDALQASEAGSTVSALLPPEVPAWLSAWIDPAIWDAALQAVQSTLQSVHGFLPLVGTVAGWLEPVVWIIWGLGMLALLTLLVVVHRWLSRRRTIAGHAG